jgi:hypothetical protein
MRRGGHDPSSSSLCSAFLTVSMSAGIQYRCPVGRVMTIDSDCEGGGERERCKGQLFMRSVFIGCSAVLAANPCSFSSKGLWLVRTGVGLAAWGGEGGGEGGEGGEGVGGREGGVVGRGGRGEREGGRKRRRGRLGLQNPRPRGRRGTAPRRARRGAGPPAAFRRTLLPTCPTFSQRNSTRNCEE